MRRTRRLREFFVFRYNCLFMNLRGGRRTLGGLYVQVLRFNPSLRGARRLVRGFFGRLRPGRRRALLELTLLGTEPLTHADANLQRDVIVERAGMRLLIGDAQFGQNVENDVGLDLKLAGQLVDADFTHTVTPGRIPSRQGFKNLQLLLRRTLISAPVALRSLS